ncbi:MAG: metallophosphoesterase [Magnetococcus sp. DMHC-8]
MLAQPTTGLTHTPPASRAEWDTSGLWDRLRSGFQEALRHLWSDEAPAAVETEPVVEPPAATPPAQLPATDPATTEAVLPHFSRTLVLSDTDNDFRTVLQMLWVTGLCDRNGSWRPGLRNVQVVHTGDWLNKWDPNPHVLDGFKRLQETTPEECRLVLLNGNHELSILQMADKGLRTSLTADDLAFIRQQQLLHVDRDTLFLHGYPSTDLLMILKQLQREKVDKTDFAERLHKVFYDGLFPLFRETRSLRIIGDIKNPKYYYGQKSQNGICQGEQTAAILQELGLTTVIHGHKPGSTLQMDHELREDLPGIRFINNDNRIRQTGWGGLLLNNQGDTVFINPHALRTVGSEKALARQLRKWMGTRRKDLPFPRLAKRSPPERIAA